MTPSSFDEECIFCRILLGVEEHPHRYRTHPETSTVSFEPLHPVAPGHLLVIPQEHVRDAAVEPGVTGQVMKQAAYFARELRPCNIITSIGEAATQSVFHLHVHVVPRRRGDGLRLPWGDHGEG